MHCLDSLFNLTWQSRLPSEVAVSVAITAVRVHVEHHQVWCCCSRGTACNTHAVFHIEVAGGIQLIGFPRL
jgi:hypothetical protein